MRGSLYASRENLFLGEQQHVVSVVTGPLLLSFICFFVFCSSQNTHLLISLYEEESGKRREKITRIIPQKISFTAVAAASAFIITVCLNDRQRV